MGDPTKKELSVTQETLPENIVLIQFVASPQNGEISVCAFSSEEERDQEVSRYGQENDPRDRSVPLDSLDLNLESGEIFIAMCLDDHMFDSFEPIASLQQLLCRAYLRGLKEEPFDLSLAAIMSSCGPMFNAVMRYFPAAVNGLSLLIGRIHKLGMNSSFSPPEEKGSP